MNSRRTFCVAVVAGMILLLVDRAAAQGESGNAYPNGIEGIKCGEIPPPGVYWRMYNYFYNANRFADGNGNKSPMNFDVSVFANANRVLWVTDWKVLGGDFFVSAMIPVLHTDLKITPPGAPGPVVDRDTCGIGDLYVDAANVIWRGDQWQAGGGVGLFLPTGKYDRNDPASPGKDMWTGMFTLAGTYWFDAERTWAASLLGRYETHTQQGERDVTYGDDAHFEWGLSKTVARGVDIGAAGYCQWQVTRDSGNDVTWNKDVRDRVFAAGPEIVVTIPPPVLLFISLRVEREFCAIDRPEGNTAVLTLTKVF